MIANKYLLLEMIGEGKFGTVFKGLYPKKNEFVAIKTESKEVNIKLLKHETYVLKYLYDNGCRCIPIIHWYGVDDINTYLVMSYYEYSLNEYLQSKKLTEKQLSKIVIACISVIEKIHLLNVIHRDIKPHNFMIRNKELFIIDFGLATFFDVNQKEQHFTREREHITGNLKYASYYIHKGFSGSFRDDLISIGFMYIVLSGLKLPWENNNDIEAIKMLKSWKTFREHCIQHKMKNSIQEYFNYCYFLKVDEIPDYKFIRELFTF